MLRRTKREQAEQSRTLRGGTVARVPKDSEIRIGEMTASPSTAGSGTEAVRGMAAVSPSTAGNLAGAVRGTTVASPMTAVDRRAAARGTMTASTMTAAVRPAVARAGATLSSGGGRVRVSGTRRGAVTAPGRLPGLPAVGTTTRVRTAMSGREAAQEGPPAPWARRLRRRCSVPDRAFP